MTIYDIARLAGVSITTVSRVINNENVAKDTKERVLKIIEECDYNPNNYAQYLGRRNSRNLSKN